MRTGSLPAGEARDGPGDGLEAPEAVCFVRSAHRAGSPLCSSQRLGDTLAPRRAIGEINRRQPPRLYDGRSAMSSSRRAVGTAGAVLFDRSVAAGARRRSQYLAVVDSMGRTGERIGDERSKTLGARLYLPCAWRRCSACRQEKDTMTYVGTRRKATPRTFGRTARWPTHCARARDRGRRVSCSAGRGPVPGWAGHPGGSGLLSCHAAAEAAMGRSRFQAVRRRRACRDLSQQPVPFAFFFFFSFFLLFTGGPPMNRKKKKKGAHGRRRLR